MIKWIIVATLFLLLLFPVLTIIAAMIVALGNRKSVLTEKNDRFLLFVGIGLFWVPIFEIFPLILFLTLLFKFGSNLTLSNWFTIGIVVYIYFAIYLVWRKLWCRPWLHWGLARVSQPDVFGKIAKNFKLPHKSTEENSNPPISKEKPPKQVSFAVLIFSETLILGVLGLYFGPDRDQLEGSLALFFGLVLIAVCIYINFCVYHGKNWARIVLLGIFLLECVLVVLESSRVDLTTIEIITDYFLLVLDLIALYLIYTLPGSKWFQKSAQ